MTKPLDDYNSADSPTFGNLIHREDNGYWKPIYPHEIGRALKHVEADYNYKLLSTSIANYRIYPAGQLPSDHPTPEDFTGNEGKFLTLKKEGTNFYWTLEEVSGDGDGGGEGDQIYYSEKPPGTSMTQDHGALEQGTLVDELSDGVKTLSQLMDAILFPTAEPDLNQPSVTLSTNTSLKEVGSLHDIALGFSASRGTIVNTWGGANQGPFAGPILSASYEQNNSGNLIPVQFSGTTLTDVTVSQYEVLEGANKWELNVEFDNGDDPLDSTGEVVAGAAFQTQTLSDAKTFTGTYPIYVGLPTGNNDYEKRSEAIVNTSAGATGLTASSGSATISQKWGENGGVRHRILVPASFGSVTIQQISPTSGEYGADNGWSGPFPTTKIVNSNTGAIAYNEYIKVGSEAGQDPSVNGVVRAKFKIIF